MGKIPKHIGPISWREETPMVILTIVALFLHKTSQFPISKRKIDRGESLSQRLKLTY